jgi:F0F1-type ATP synthase assembly protein I
VAAIGQREQEERRKLNQGFGAALTNAFDIALVPVMFAAIGWLVDRGLGTGWVFTTILGIVGLVGVFVKLYYRYSSEMEQLEASGPWRRAAQQDLP